MRFLYTISRAAIAALLACALPCASLPQPAREKSVWNYDGGVMLITDGSVPNGPCFRISGRMTAGNFFDNLKRIDTDGGAIFRRGSDTITKFPDRVTLAFVVYDLPCLTQLRNTTTRVYLTRSLMSTLHLYLYWKSGVELHPIASPEPKYFSVDPVMPYAAALAHNLPQKFEWSYEFEIPSAGIPLTDSLVLVLRTPDGHMAARVAARL